MARDELLSAALEYAARGLLVLPCWWPLNDGSCACGEECGNAGKHPLGSLVPHGLHNATTDEATIRGWWTAHPKANVAVRTGKESGAVVLDVDPRHGGDEALRDLEQKHGKVPETIWTKTGGGGEHGWFRWPGHPVKGIKGIIGPGLDMQGDGNYVLMPPSRHASGGVYAWDQAAGEVPLADLPPWLDVAQHVLSVARSDAPEIPEVIEKGARDAMLTSLAGTMRRRGTPEPVIYAALSAANAEMCRPRLADSQVRKIAHSIAARPPAEAERFSRNGHVEEPGLKELWTWQRILRTHFEPPRWLLDRLIPELGLTILSGKPKVGKSWLALQIAGAIGSGDEVLGRRAVHGRVLYFCIEDPVWRIKDRGQKQEWLEESEVVFAESLEALDAGGMTELERVCDAVKPVLVVIDTFAAAKSGKTNENEAGPMADLGNGLQRFAQMRRLALLLVAHQRKGLAENPVEALRGSGALGAAADMVLGLRKHPPAFVLETQGRDAEDAEYRMDFEDFRWKLRGDQRLLAHAEAEAEVLEALARLGESDASTVGRELSWSRQTAMRHLKELEMKNRVVSHVEHGQEGRFTRVIYRLAQPGGQTTFS